MTDKLPPNLLALFAPRPALRYLPAGDHAPEERRTNNISGVAHFLEAFKDYESIPFEPTESWLERKIRVKAEKKERQDALLTEGFSQRMRSLILFLNLFLASSKLIIVCLTVDKPDDDPQVRGDAFKTLFVARLSYDTTEMDLEREFGRFGAIERVYCTHYIFSAT